MSSTFIWTSVLTGTKFAGNENVLKNKWTYISRVTPGQWVKVRQTIPKESDRGHCCVSSDILSTPNRLPESFELDFLSLGRCWLVPRKSHMILERYDVWSESFCCLQLYADSKSYGKGWVRHMNFKADVVISTVVVVDVVAVAVIACVSISRSGNSAS
jgi:hypothetical protein